MNQAGEVVRLRAQLKAATDFYRDEREEWHRRLREERERRIQAEQMLQLILDEIPQARAMFDGLRKMAEVLLRDHPDLIEKYSRENGSSEETL